MLLAACDAQMNKIWAGVYALVCEYVLHVCVRCKVWVVALMLSVYVHGRAMQMYDIGCCVYMCSKQVIGCRERSWK